MYKTEDRSIVVGDVVVALKTSLSGEFVKGELYTVSKILNSILRTNKDSNKEINGWNIYIISSQ